MSSPSVLDLDSLLTPISGDIPSGEDLRLDASPSSPYYSVKDARTAAKAAERQLLMGLDDEESVARPDWSPIVREAPKLLATRSKDLEISAYLIEALARIEGFPGLRDGFRLVHGLCENFWDTLYPTPDEEGLFTRVAPITGLNGDDAEGTLLQPIVEIPITDSAEGVFSTRDYEQANELERLDPEKKERRIKNGAISLQIFERASAGTSPSFYRQLLEDITETEEAFLAMIAWLDEKCGDAAPPSSGIRNALRKVHETVESISKAILASGAEAAPAEDAAAAGAPQAGAAGGPAVAAGPVANRETALKTLLQVAEFFRRTEPHTPLSYALEQAVRWGRMSLPDLLVELIPDDSARHEMFKRVGIQEPEES